MITKNIPFTTPLLLILWLKLSQASNFLLQIDVFIIHLSALPQIEFIKQEPVFVCEFWLSDIFVIAYDKTFYKKTLNYKIKDSHEGDV